MRELTLIVFCLVFITFFTFLLIFTFPCIIPLLVQFNNTYKKKTLEYNFSIMSHKITVITFILWFCLKVMMNGDGEEYYDDLVRFSSRIKRSTELCCNDAHLLSCIEVELNILKKKKIKILGTNFLFSNNVDPNGVVYKSSNGDEAILNYNSEKHSMHGSIQTHDGKSYFIEKCNKGHVIKEMDIAALDDLYYQNLKDTNSMQRNKRDIIKRHPKGFVKCEEIIDHRTGRKKHTKFECEGIERHRKMIIDNTDNSTLVIYSIAFYYHKDFSKVTSDMQGWFEWAVNTQNQLFKNSRIPIQAKIFCIEEEPITPSGKIEPKNLKIDLKPADQHVQVGLTGCGGAWGTKYRHWDEISHYSISYWSKACASGVNSIAHETGHNFGCGHNVELYKPKEVNEDLIDRGTPDAAFGFRYNESIATAVGGNSIQYFSNPNIIHPSTGIRLGVKGISNCAGVIMRHRFSWARNGDETGICNSKSKS